MHRALIALAVSTLLGLGVLSGCAGSAAETSAGGRSFTKADVDFALQLQAHHQQALVMAGMAVDKATSPQIRQLAERINETQGREIDLLAAWIQKVADQGAKLPGHGPGGHGPHGPGMMSEADMGDLKRASGGRFDEMWLRMMIEHHRGALVMAHDELEHGQNAQTQQLARDVLRTQKAEIVQMRDMLAS